MKIASASNENLPLSELETFSRIYLAREESSPRSLSLFSPLAFDHNQVKTEQSSFPFSFMAKEKLGENENVSLSK